MDTINRKKLLMKLECRTSQLVANIFVYERNNSKCGTDVRDTIHFANNSFDVPIF